MYNKIFLITLLIVALFQTATNIAAHPLDVSTTNLVLKDNSNQHIDFDIHLPWLEANLLFKPNQIDVSSPSAQLIRQFTPELQNYISDNFIVINQNKQCPLTEFQVPDQKPELILLGNGLTLTGKFQCPDPFKLILIHSNLFLDIFPTQTNIVNVYHNRAEPNLLITAGVLTQQNQELYVDIENQTTTTSNTNPAVRSNNNIYTDTIINQFINTNSSLLLILIIGLLGLLHTLEAGHSKSILAAITIDNRINFKQSLAYTTVFTITHVADLIVLGGLFLIANQFTDLYQRLPYLQIIAQYHLVFIALYLLLKETHRLAISTFGKQHKHQHNLETQKNFKEQLLMGFVAGLAPCVFGWSLFIALISTGQAWLILPGIISFGMGIFLGLLVVVSLIHISKTTLNKKFTTIMKFSPLISALILLLFSLIQIWK